MRGDKNIQKRACKIWIARHCARVKGFFSVLREKIFQNIVWHNIHSRFRGIEIRVAHQAGMSVNEFDARRRAFLKYALFGGTLFLAGKYANPIINTLRGDKILSEQTFQNFKLTETGKELRVTDDDGNEILTIDKENF